MKTLNSLICYLLIVSAAQTLSAMDIDAQAGVSVYIIETRMIPETVAGMRISTGKYVNHQGLRFETPWVEGREAHFALGGIDICVSERRHGGTVEYMNTKYVGYLKNHTIGQCTRWCQRWGNRNLYSPPVRCCWSLIKDFLNDHDLDHSAADKGSCSIM